MKMSEEKHLNCTTGDDVIDFSKRQLSTFPDGLSPQNNLRFCYLDDNQFTQLPINFFRDLPRLEWLDLRNNCLVELPTNGLAGHKCLQVLLLQSNRIKNLPKELALVPQLKGLQLLGNPIENVPFDVINLGFESVINFLRTLDNNDSKLPMPVSETIITKQPPNKKSKQNIRSKPPNLKSSSSASTCSKSQNSSRISSMLVTEEQIILHEKEDREKAMLRETLERQSAMLQRIKDAEAVKSWRKIIRTESRKKFLDNFQYSPSRNFLEKTPFDVDMDMMKMLSRADLYKSLSELNAQPRKTVRKREKSYEETVRDLQSQIDNIKKKLNAIDFQEKIENVSEKKHYLTTRIDEINKLRDQLIKLNSFNVNFCG